VEAATSLRNFPKLGFKGWRAPSFKYLLQTVFGEASDAPPPIGSGKGTEGGLTGTSHSPSLDPKSTAHQMRDVCPPDEGCNSLQGGEEVSSRAGRRSV